VFSYIHFYVLTRKKRAENFVSIEILYRKVVRFEDREWERDSLSPTKLLALVFSYVHI